MKRVTMLKVGLALLALIALPAFSQGGAGAPPTTAQPPAGEAMSCPMHQMTPEMRAHMMAMVQEFLTMSQNTAVWTPQGLTVLQGNRVLHYGPDLALRHQVALPLPQMPAGAPAVNLRSQVPARLIPTDAGIIVVRGQQIIRLNNQFQVMNVAMLPALPPLTPAETAAVCPLCGQMAQMMAMGMMGMPGTDVAAAPPATTAPEHQH